jgi:hypothetical protein
MDPRVDWITKQEPKKLTQMGKLFQTVGIQVPGRLEEAMTEAFNTTKDGRRSYWALKELKEFRPVTKEKWQEWNKLVRSKFKEEDYKEESQDTKPQALTIGETIEMLRSVKRGNTAWRQEAEEWVPRLNQGRMETARKSLDLRLRHARPRLKSPRRLWIEVIPTDRWMTR